MKSLFVGNLNFQTTEGELRALFEPFGAVTRVHMAMDRETGRARGFAFIEMPNDDEAAKAITGLDGRMVGGRQLKVNEARPRGEGGGPPRGWRESRWRWRLRRGGGNQRRRWWRQGQRAAGEVAIVFRPKITAIPCDSRANRAGRRLTLPHKSRTDVTLTFAPDKGGLVTPT